MACRSITRSKPSVPGGNSSPSTERLWSKKRLWPPVRATHPSRYSRAVVSIKRVRAHREGEAAGSQGNVPPPEVYCGLLRRLAKHKSCYDFRNNGFPVVARVATSEI